MAAAVMTCVLTAAFSAHAENLSESAEALVSGEEKNDDDAQAEDIILSLDNETIEEGEGRDSGVSIEFTDEESETAEEASGVISMSLSYGFHNIAKSGRMLPFYVDINNDTDEDIEGKLVIEVQGSTETDINKFENAAVYYSFNVYLPKNQLTKLKNTISISESGSGAKLTLYDSEGNVLCEDSTDVILQPGSGAELLIGILSDSPEKLEYFKNINIPGTSLRTRTVELDPDNMPETASGLEQLDIVLISDFEPDEISDEAQNALKNWTEAGGVLLIGTGNRMEAARELGRGLKDLSIGNASGRKVNMGLKYSKTNPDDAELELDVCSIFAADGIQVMQSDDIAMLTTAQKGSGIVGLAAYDFCDISDFCSEEIEYTEDILKGLMGSSRLTQLANSAGDNDELYQKADELIGIADPDRLPNAAVYILFCLFYLGLIGAGIYFYLRRRGLSVFYHAFVPIAAFMSAILLWLISSGLRNDGISFDYAVMRELHDGYASDNGFMKVSASSLNDYSLSVPSDYEIHPIVHGAGEEANSLSLDYYLKKDADMQSDASIYIDNSENSATVKLDGMKPFAGILTEYSARIRGDEINGSIDSKLSCFNENISGSISNNTDYDLKGAVLMMYGRMVKLGDIDSGEEIKLDGRKITESPIGDGKLLAAKVSDIGAYDRGSVGHVRALRRDRLFSWYIDNTLCGYFSGARIIAFADGVDLVSKVSSESHIESHGLMLINAQADMTFEKEEYTWSGCLETEPNVVSGDYNAAENTADGTCVIEYALGNDITISELIFKSLDAGFENKDMGIFMGAVSFYNYQSGGYDLIGSDIYDGIAQNRLTPYLSPGNTVTVRYTVDDAAIGKRRLYLPVPYAVGAKRH